jgi:hypothetical protein
MTVLTTVDLRDTAMQAGLTPGAMTHVALKGFAEPVAVVAILGS